MTYLACPVVSPLTFDVDSTEAFMHFAEEGLPHYVVGAPNAGMTAPLTLLGTLVVCNAEFLAQGVLAQMSRPGTPLIYGQIATVADMRTGAYAPGGIETGMLLMGCAQMARTYDVPCAGFAGVTNAKVNDAQSGYEAGMPALAAALAGVHLVVMGCVIDALMAFDFGAAVIGSEIGQMVKRAARGFETDEKELALEAIAEAGPGGTFIDSAHTLKRIRTTALLPTLADRLPRDQWQARGALDTHARAMHRVHEILAGENPAVFSPEVDARVRAGFAGLVAGDATALEPRNH
jgi:trimethylamine--corrinoid protein Co-methyltransferase